MYIELRRSECRRALKELVPNGSRKSHHESDPYTPNPTITPPNTVTLKHVSERNIEIRGVGELDSY